MDSASSSLRPRWLVPIGRQLGLNVPAWNPPSHAESGNDFVVVEEISLAEHGIEEMPATGGEFAVLIRIERCLVIHAQPHPTILNTVALRQAELLRLAVHKGLAQSPLSVAAP